VFGPRYNAECLNIITTEGHALPWVDEVKYLGIIILRSRFFECSFDQAKRAFYRSLNAVFGRVGRLVMKFYCSWLTASVYQSQCMVLKLAL
jgi:hypothetical protein